MEKVKASEGFVRLLGIMDELREKCPWDRKQTFQSLRKNTIEETYELVEAINNNDFDNVREELGDLLLHIVFYSKLGSEQGSFTIEDVVVGICNKLVERHPHIYGDVIAEDEETVKKNWEKIKLASKPDKHLLDGMPRSLPAMIKATRIQEKAKQVGFDWDDIKEVRHKIDEELGELERAIGDGNQKEMEDELGDVLFSVVNYARFLKIDPEDALEKTNKKFMGRFAQMEKFAKERGQNIGNLTPIEWETLWQEAKKHFTT